MLNVCLHLPAVRPVWYSEEFVFLVVAVTNHPATMNQPESSFFPQSNCRTNDVYWWSPTGICNIETLEGATVIYVKSFRTTNRLCVEFDNNNTNKKNQIYTKFLNNILFINFSVNLTSWIMATYISAHLSVNIYIFLKSFTYPHHGHDCHVNCGQLGPCVCCIVFQGGMIVQVTHLVTQETIIGCTGLNLLWIFSKPHRVKYKYTHQLIFKCLLTSNTLTRCFC